MDERPRSVGVIPVARLAAVFSLLLTGGAAGVKVTLKAKRRWMRIMRRGILHPVRSW